MNRFDERAEEWDADPARVARALAVAERIAAMVPLSPAMTALEYGCGTGLLGFALAPWLGALTLADSSEGMLAVLRRKIAAAAAPNMTALKLDLTTDPPPAERYDLVLALMTLHHVPDTARILRDFHALLEPGGYLALSDLDREDGSFHGEGFAGHHGFDRVALGSLAEAAGFEEIRFDTPCTVTRTVNGEARAFPLFLMTARKPRP